MHGQSKLLALLLCLVLLSCQSNAADLAEDQEALVRSLVDSAATADQNATQVRLALFDVDAQRAGAKEGEKKLKTILEAQSTIACQIVSAREVQEGVLKGFDVVLFPGGYAPKQFALLDDAGRQAVRDFVRGGGGYVGICAGAFLASSKYGAGLELINATPLGRIDESGKMIPSSGPHGAGKVKMDLTDAGRKLFGRPAGEFEALFSGGPVFSPAGTELPKYVSLGMFRGQPPDYESQQGDMAGTPAILAGRFGDGKVIVFGPHLEFTEGFESLLRRGVLAARRFSPAAAAGQTEQGAPTVIGGQVADPGFDTKVAQPAFVSKHPVLLFDEAHDNYHTAGGRYKPFAELMTGDGFRVIPGTEEFTPTVLSKCQILVIANAPGHGSDSLSSAFTTDECDAVERFVKEGGSLLLITDHPPFGAGSAQLASRFGVDMSQGVARDPVNETNFALHFDRDKNQLGDHPILDGRNGAERVNRVLTFRGQSLKGPAGSAPLLKLADTAVDETEKGNLSAAGRAQGVALQYGKGRIVVMGEAAELTAETGGNEPFGMNVPGCDNRQFALNIMRWLAGLTE